MGDQDDATGEDQERFIKVNVLEPEVLVRDDQGDLQEMKEMTDDLLDQAVEAHERLAEEGPNGGVH